MEKIQGSTFKAMLESGANNLSNNYQMIDALNVFPVPDGDTGTNMNLTFSSGVKEVKNTTLDNVGDIAKVLSKGLLMGARGNSGVILSQIFRGFAQGVEGKNDIDALTFAKAFVKGSEIAYKAVMRPVEGTILTVIREGSKATLTRTTKEKITEIEKVMNILVEECKLSLSRTPDLLPVLKEVGVVDSGGTGLTTILEGFKACLDGNPIEATEVTVVANSTASALESEEFGYCTEFILRLNKDVMDTFNEDKLRNKLARIGESLVVVQDEDIVKVHVHTLMPGEALNMGQKYGEFLKLKIENMSEQHENLLVSGKEPGKPAAPAKEYGIIAVAAGEGLEEYFKDLRVDLVVSGGQTMNPSTEDFVEAVKKVNAKHIIILPNNSNIVMAANQAADICDDKDVKVIPTKTIPQGISACIMFNPDITVEENLENMSEAVANVKTGQVTYAIKDTTYDGLTINANDYMGIKEKDIIVSEPSKMEVTKKLLDSLVGNDAELVTLIIGEGVSEEEQSEIEAYIEEEFDVECETVMGGQPVYSFFIGVE
ncbi:MAG: DAK2 domain-containing protein [Erysipelotrichales bacterium]|nr:DAK2 domain-containing protein [Erysipelotrichales bacterium]